MIEHARDPITPAPPAPTGKSPSPSILFPPQTSPPPPPSPLVPPPPPASPSPAARSVALRLFPSHASGASAISSQDVLTAPLGRSAGDPLFTASVQASDLGYLHAPAAVFIPRRVGLPPSGVSFLTFPSSFPVTPPPPPRRRLLSAEIPYRERRADLCVPVQSSLPPRVREP
ncbi:hypothetical protein OH77DRAFT_1524396 [Trametes cingulata]|nr:hypothetical protein OH77DRAFT_1524396 [Trametes cingulata]